MKKKLKVLFVFIIIGILIILTWNIIDNQRILSGICKKAYIYELNEDEVKSLKYDGYPDFELSRENIDTVMKHSEDFLILQYEFEFFNQSSLKNIQEMEISIQFPEEIQKSIYAYSKKGLDGGVVPLDINPRGNATDSKRIIINKTKFKRKLLKLLSQVKFKFKGKVVLKKLGVELPFGTCTTAAEYDKNFRGLLNEDRLGPREKVDKSKWDNRDRNYGISGKKPAGCESKMRLFKNITVVECEIPRIGAGTICTWIKITIEKENKKKDFVFYPNIVVKDFPIKGHKYDIYYTIRDLEGMIGLKDYTKVKNAKIVEKYTKRN